MKNDKFNGRYYVTIDTEMDADIHWKKAYPPRFTSVLEGIPHILRPIWDKYNVNPIYFVSPEVVENEQCCIVLKNEVIKGAIIGAHLHPEYIEPLKKDMSKHERSEFPCSEYSTEIEKEKLINLTSLIEKNIGVRPIWYRAARFGADSNTIKILAELGYKYDSSFTPCIDWRDRKGPNHKLAPIGKYYIDPNDIYNPNNNRAEGVEEYPVTIMGKRLGIIGRILPENWLFYRWIRPSHMTYIEQKGMIKKLKHDNIKDIVMMFHSMELMVGKTPYVRAKWMQRYYIWRLEKTLAFLNKEGYIGKA
jgi:hypothetical protein